MLQAPAFSRFRDSVTVWPDDVLFYRFYPMSDGPRVRRGADGLPVLLLVEYALSDTERAANPQLPPGGGYLALDTTLDVPDDALTALRAELQTRVDAEWARLRAGTPAEQAKQGVAGTTAPPAVEFGTPTFTKGAVHLDAPHSAVLVEARVAESVPTLLGGNVASFSLDLTPSGASFVRQSLLAPDGSAATDTDPLQVGYDLTFWARLPPASIHIAVDQRRAYDYARKQLEGRGIDHCTTYDFDHTDLTTETITQSGAVTVQIDTGSGTMPGDVIDKLRGYALDLVKQLVAGAVFAKADPPAGGATPYVLRRDEAFQQELHSATDMTLTVDLVQSSVVEWTVHPQGVLQTDLAGTDAATMQRLIRRVSLADGFFDHLDVTVRAFADFKPMGVSHVELQLEYTGTGADGVAQTKTQAFTITDGSAQRWQPAMIGDARTFRYRWRAVLDGHPAPEFGEWSSSSQPVVDIVVPEPGVVAVEVLAGNIDFDEVVAQAQVHLAYEDPAAGVPRQEETFVLTAPKPSASYLRSVPAQVTQPVRYRVGWVLASGEVRAPGDWQDVPGPVLLVNQPDTPLLRVSVLPAGNAWPGVQSAVVEVRYRSGMGADDVRTVTLTAADQFRTVTFLPPPGGPRSFDHRRHVSYKGGRFEETGWTADVTDPVVAVDLTVAGFDVLVDGTLLDLTASPLTEVTLTRAAGTGTPPQQTTLLYHDRSAQTWHVDAPAGAPVEYTWQVVHHPVDRDPVTLPPQVEHDTVVVLPPYRPAVAGELAVDVIANLVDFGATPLVAVDLAYDDDENDYHLARDLVLSQDGEHRLTWKVPTKDARKVAFSYTITYFTKDGSPHPGATGASTTPRVIVAAYHP